VYLPVYTQISRNFLRESLSWIEDRTLPRDWGPCELPCDPCRVLEGLDIPERLVLRELGVAHSCVLKEFLCWKPASCRIDSSDSADWAQPGAELLNRDRLL
jgi:hypothetical protein